MKKSVQILLLITFAVAASHILLLVAYCVPQFYITTFNLPWKDVWDTMPVPTRFVCQKSWLAPVVLLGVVIVSTVLVHKYPTRASAITTLGLCSEAFMFWLTMLAFCYDAVCGPMCLHHDPEFEITEFCQFGFGVFPVVLLAILTPAVVTVWQWVKDRPKPAP